MRSLRRRLCADCGQNLREALLIYRERGGGEPGRCDWCRRRAPLKSYEILYDRKH